MLTWVTNFHDDDFESVNERHAFYLRHVMGDPKATADCTVEQLKAMGMRGAYVKSSEPA